MMSIKTKLDITKLREGGKILAQVLSAVKVATVPGVKTAELDALAYKLITEAGAKPAFLHYRPEGAKSDYPASLCVSVNEEIVHGIPGPRVLKNGDVVSLDLGIEYKGLFTDMATTVLVGKGKTADVKLLRVTEEALAVGIEAAVAGGTTGDIGAAVEAYVKKQGFVIVKGLAGHGVGYEIHEEPFVPNYGRAGHGEELVPGLVIAIEPMVTTGTSAIKLMPDGYTFVTRDGGRSAHFERTIVITKDGPEILTQI
jgi:methionyl aminopeptidase